jgi:hypothetical protein
MIGQSTLMIAVPYLLCQLLFSSKTFIKCRDFQAQRSSSEALLE